MHCFLPMVVPVVAVGKPRALLYDESAYESDWQWLPLARGQRYRDYLMRAIRRRCRVWPPDRHSGSFASEAMSSSVRPNLTVYEASQFKR